MKPKLTERDLSTTEVAKYCHVSCQTATRWIDTGFLKGYRIPDSKFRRVKKQDLIEFVKLHNLPIHADLENAK